MRNNSSSQAISDGDKSENLKKTKRLKQSSILMAVLPLAACGGDATPSGNTPAPTPDPDFIESPTNVFIALDDSDRTLSEGDNVSSLTVTGKAGSDSITTGSGADIIVGAAGNDTIVSNGGNDLIHAGEGGDTVSAGSGNDAIVVVGTTTATQYTDTDITIPAGSGIDLSSLISLADLNGRSVSEVSAGESIDGGSGTDTLYVYGTVDLTGVTLNNLTVLIVNSDVTLTAEQMALFTIVDGDGTSTINIKVPPGDTYIIDLSVLTITDIAVLNIDGDVTFIINDENDLDEIGAINTDASDDVTVEINGNGGGTTTVNLGALTDKFDGVDTIKVELDVVLEITDPNDVTDLGLSDISGNGEVDTGGDPDIDNAIVGIENLNKAPDATDDFVETNESINVVVDVLSNDSDPDLDDMTITNAVVTSGTATVQIINNKLSVTPDSSYELLASNQFSMIGVSYDVSDNNGHTSSADLDIKVNGVDTVTNGTAGNDILNGSSDGDIINGLDGDDKINGGGNTDVLNGGAGNDVFSAYVDDNSIEDDIFNGGNGYDAIELIGNDPVTAVETPLGNLTQSNIEEIRLSDGMAEYVSVTPISLENFVADTSDDLSKELYELFVTGHQEDKILLDPDFEFDTYVIVNGELFQHYIDTAPGNKTYSIYVSTSIGTITSVNVPAATFDEISADNWLATGVSQSVLSASDSSNNLTVNGNSGEDIIFTGSGDDIINGLAGNDTIAGGTGADTIDGGTGEDTFIATSASGSFEEDIFDGGDGADILSLFGDDTVTPVIFDLADLSGSNLEEIELSDGNAETIIVSAADIISIGTDTSDNSATNYYIFYINGHEEDSVDLSNDLIFSGYLLANHQVYQTYSHSSGNDTVRVYVSLEIGTINSGTAPATTYLETSENIWEAQDPTSSALSEPNNTNNLTVTGGIGEDYIATGSGDDVINPGDGSNYVETGAGDDTVNGGSGDDYLYGSTGADILDGGIGVDDYLSYSWSDAAVNINLADGTASGGYADGDTILNVEQIGGSSYDDTLTGDAGNNTLSGGSGDDTIFGGDGNDLILGGKGSDSLNGDDNSTSGNQDTLSYSDSDQGVDLNVGAGVATVGGDTDFFTKFEIYNGSNHDDIITGAANSFTYNALGGDDIIIGGLGGEHLYGDDGNDTISGNGGIDTLEGGDGDDTLDGGTGVDTLIGGLGTDTMIYDAADSFDGGLDNTFDMLKLEGSGYNIDLSLVNVVQISVIDIGGSGNNSLTLIAQDVLDVTETQNQLLILGDAGDSVTSTGQSWVYQGDIVHTGGETLNHYFDGQANLYVDVDITQDIS